MESAIGWAWRNTARGCGRDVRRHVAYCRLRQLRQHLKNQAKGSRNTPFAAHNCTSSCVLCCMRTGHANAHTLACNHDPPAPGQHTARFTPTQTHTHTHTRPHTSPTRAHAHAQAHAHAHAHAHLPDTRRRTSLGPLAGAASPPSGSFSSAYTLVRWLAPVTASTGTGPSRASGTPGLRDRSGRELAAARHADAFTTEAPDSEWQTTAATTLACVCV